uniref:CSON005498 protein n=1 Tax=Culicoides sonorensis TaxID=179676 RepID=A0A336MUQ8_CULSO
MDETQPTTFIKLEVNETELQEPKEEILPIPMTIVEKEEPLVVSKSRSGRVLKQKLNSYKEKNENQIYKDEKLKLEPIVQLELINNVNNVPEPQNEPPKKKRIRNRRPKPTEFYCCICRIAFKLETEVISHAESLHSIERDYNKNQKYTSHHIFECKFCKFKFRRLKNVRKHMDDPSFIEPRRYRKEEYANRKARGNVKREHVYQKAVCSTCGKVVSSKQQLKIHEFRLHAEEFPVACTHPGCERRFAGALIMRAHLRSHAPKKYVCETCGKGFSTEKVANIHAFLHKDVKRYQCDLCPRTFTYKLMLRRHIENHVLEKIFRCDQCEKTYKWEGDLKKHIQGAHLGDLPFKCKFCFKGYFSKSSCKYHEKRCQLSSNLS